MHRQDIFDAAMDAVKDRGTDYGSPLENFNRIANLWEAYTGQVFTAQDVGIMMMLVKVSRLMENPKHFDSWVDIAGYSAITAEAIIDGDNNESV